MEAPNLRPSVVISSYSTVKRIERQQKQASAGQPNQECATRAELSTHFFKPNLSVGEPSKSQRLLAPFVLVNLSQIHGPTGSVRGHKNVVRRSLEGIKMAYSRRPTAASTESRPKLSTFGSQASAGSGWTVAASHHAASKYSPTNSHFQSLQTQTYCSEYLERLADEERGLCVAYTTTLGVIRRTFEDSKTLKTILNLNLIKFEERDIYLNQEYKFQLKIRLESLSVPALFVDGQLLGGLAELETMNENGELLKRLASFKMSKATVSICSCCGNARFIACPACNGSRKSTIHHFKFNSIALRCIRCDENDGLVMCPACCATRDQESEHTDEANQLKSVDENNNAQVETMAKRQLELVHENECNSSKC